MWVACKTQLKLANIREIKESFSAALQDQGLSISWNLTSSSRVACRGFMPTLTFQPVWVLLQIKVYVVPTECHKVNGEKYRNYLEGKSHRKHNVPAITPSQY